MVKGKNNKNNFNPLTLLRAIKFNKTQTNVVLAEQYFNNCKDLILKAKNLPFTINNSSNQDFYFSYINYRNFSIKSKPIDKSMLENKKCLIQKKKK